MMSWVINLLLITCRMDYGVSGESNDVKEKKYLEQRDGIM